MIRQARAELCFAVDKVRASTFLSASQAMDRSDAARGTVFILCSKFQRQTILLEGPLVGPRQQCHEAGQQSQTWFRPSHLLSLNAELQARSRFRRSVASVATHQLGEA